MEAETLVFWLEIFASMKDFFFTNRRGRRERRERFYGMSHGRSRMDWEKLVRTYPELRLSTYA